MAWEDFMIGVYCFVEEIFGEVTQGIQLRQRGPAPQLTDVEVLAMEVIGAGHGLVHSRDIWRYFRDHWRAWFPALGDRSAFVRQAAALQHVKQRMLHWFARHFFDDVNL